MTTTVATTNLQAHMALWKVARSVRKVRRKAHPDLWDFQEIGGLHKWALIRTTLGVRYAGHRFPGEGSATPIAWHRRRYRRRHFIVWHLSDPTDVGASGAGPRVLRGKNAVGVVLDDRRTGKTVVIVNAHLAPSPWLDSARDHLHSEQVTNLSLLVDFTKKHYPGADLFFAGDWNTTQRNRFTLLEHSGLILGPDVPTHGAHALDRIASTLPRKDAYTIPNDSDHDALIGRY